MKTSFLILALFSLACSTSQTKQSSSTNVELKAKSLDQVKTEISPKRKALVAEVKKIDAPVEKAPAQIKAVQPEIHKVTAEVKKIDAPVEKAPAQIKAVEVKKIVTSTPPKTLEISPPALVKVPSAPKEIILPTEKLLKVKGFKKLFKYEKAKNGKNYIYASKYTSVEIDGQKLIKIKLNSSGSYINLPISKKLKSGKYIVSAIITVNNHTSKIEFSVLSVEKAVDFALSSTSLKQFQL